MHHQYPIANTLGWLALSQVEGVGPLGFHAIRARFATVDEAFSSLQSSVGPVRLKHPWQFYMDQAQREWDICERSNIHIVSSSDMLYPPLLRHIHDAPPFIRLKGNSDLLAKPCIALVGARNASLSARKMAEQLAADLGSAGMVCVSGLARGVDTHVHKGSLVTGTVAVIAGGMDVVYPPENNVLMHTIAEQGVIVAEMPWGTEPKAHFFPRRNRIISGLSLGTVVVEAGLGSGSLITARFALEQGREVYAVPGFPLDPRAKGTNALIKEGAALVESAEDILRQLPVQLGHVMNATLMSQHKEEDVPHPQRVIDNPTAKIIEMLGVNPVAIDDLVHHGQWRCEDVLVILAELELQGVVQRHPGNAVSLVC